MFRIWTGGPLGIALMAMIACGDDQTTTDLTGGAGGSGSGAGSSGGSAVGSGGLGGSPVGGEGVGASGGSGGGAAHGGAGGSGAAGGAGASGGSSGSGNAGGAGGSGAAGGAGGSGAAGGAGGAGASGGAGGSGASGGAGASGGSGGSGGAGGAGAAGGAGGAGAAGGAGGSGGGVTDTPCASGPGSTLWRIEWAPNSGGYADVEAWDNGCTYSLADQACSLSGEPHDYANFGPGVVFNSSTDYFRVRYSAAGLSFDSATLYIRMHADGGGIPQAVLESPIYGSLSFAPQVPISQHKLYAVDWSDFLSPSDAPSLTAVTLRSMPTGLAVSYLELCAE